MILPIFANSYYPAAVIPAVLVTQSMFKRLVVVLLEIISQIQILTQNSNSIIGVPLVREDPTTSCTRHDKQIMLLDK